MSVAPAVAALLTLYALWFLYQQQGTCVRCQGRGGHRRDCPLARRDGD
jgi:hypothetical protein